MAFQTILLWLLASLPLVNETSIDLSLTNHDESDVKAGVLLSVVSEHLPLFCFITKRTFPEVTSERSTKAKRAIDNFRQKIASVNWIEILDKKSDSNFLYNSFLKKIIEIYEYSFPLVTVSKFRKARKPWITYDCVKRIKARDKLFRNFLKHKE